MTQVDFITRGCSPSPPPWHSPKKRSSAVAPSRRRRGWLAGDRLRASQPQPGRGACEERASCEVRCEFPFTFIALRQSHVPIWMPPFRLCLQVWQKNQTPSHVCSSSHHCTPLDAWTVLIHRCLAHLGWRDALDSEVFRVSLSLRRSTPLVRTSGIAVRHPCPTT